jgi:hypothetical protein
VETDSKLRVRIAQDIAGSVWKEYDVSRRLMMRHCYRVHDMLTCHTATAALLKNIGTETCTMPCLDPFGVFDLILEFLTTGRVKCSAEKTVSMRVF